MKGQKTGGRVAGTPNKATRDLKAVAADYGPAAIKRLAWLMDNAESEQTQAYAADKLLDRGYGKPAQAIIPQNEDGSAYEPLGSGELARSIAFLLQRGAEKK